MLRTPCRLSYLVLMVAGLSALGLYYEAPLQIVHLNRKLLVAEGPTSSTSGMTSFDKQQETVYQPSSSTQISAPHEVSTPWLTATTYPQRSMATSSDTVTEATSRDVPTIPHFRDPSLSNRTSKGYVLALDYWEQQTSASRNLQSLQCWAAQYNLSVVEPMMAGSTLRTPLHDRPIEHGFWFRDLFDLDMWNRLSSEKGHSGLVGWEEFLYSAPREVILVSFRHAYLEEIRQNLKKTSAQHKPPSQRVQEGCTTKWEATEKFFNKHHFTVIRRVCFNFVYGDKLSSRQFNTYLYGSLSPSSSTVVFSQWRGSGTPARVLIHDIKCGNTRIQEVVKPSQALILSVRQYQNTYLRGQPYIAIMARMEKVQALIKKSTHPPTLAQCFSKMLAAWSELKTHSGINTTLLAIDMGKFGSNSIHNVGRGSELRINFEQFFKTLYGTQFTPESWEDSFEHVAHTTDSGYVALLQKILVVQAQCVVFIGGGSFQKHAQSLYLRTHYKEQCGRIINECTPPNSLHDMT